MRLETKRLILREYTEDDYQDLSQILTDKETMKYYSKPYDETGVRRWLDWNYNNYQKYGFGLFALILKENGKFIGDCGITFQKINGEIKPEIGYHINKKYWRQGYATEASQKWRDYAFENLGFNEIYSYMKYSNIPSIKTAEKNGMKLINQYDDTEDTILYVYRITKDEWKQIKNG